MLLKAKDSLILLTKSEVAQVICELDVSVHFAKTMGILNQTRKVERTFQTLFCLLILACLMKYTDMLNRWF